MTYTLGPWKVEGLETYAIGSHGHYQAGITIEGDDNMIAELCGWQSEVEVIANAHLIAKAPEMLDLLKKIQSAGETPSDLTDQEHEDLWQDLSDFLEPFTQTP